MVFVFLWFTSLSMIISGSIYVALNGYISFFYGWITFHFMSVPHLCPFLCPWGCFQVLASVSSAAMNTEVHGSFWITVFSRYMPSSRIAGLYCSSISSFLCNFHTVFHGGCTNLIYHQQCKRVSFSPHPLPHSSFVDFFWWWPFWLVWGDNYLIAVSICIYLIVMLNIFSYVSWLFVSLHGEMCIYVLYFFVVVCFVFDIELLVYFGD